MKIIDVNAAIGYVPGRTEPPDTPESLIRKMDRAGVDCAVAFHTRSVKQIGSGNRDIQAIAEASGGRIHACWLLHPYMDGVQMPKKEDLPAILNKYRPAAVRLNPCAGNYLLNRFYCDELLDILRRLRIPVMLDSMTDLQNPLEALPCVAEEYPEIPFVLADVCHKSSMLVRTLLRKRKNVYFAIGYMVGCGELDQLVGTFGAEHFLYSSSDGNAQGTALGLVCQGSFSLESKEAIFSGNWDRLQEGIRWES